MNERLEAWMRAENLVEPIVQQHGLEQYSVGQVFNTTTKVTQVDQHIDQIMRVADWLLEGENR